MAHTATKTITAAVLENGNWLLRQIEKGLDPINALVGGYITQVPLRDPAVILYANEDGLRLALPQSAVQVIPETGEWVEILVGTLVAFGPAKAGEETDATEVTIVALNRHLIPVVRTEKVVRFE